MTGRPVAECWTWAVRGGGSTGRVGFFGFTRNGGSKQHAGVDFLAELGDPVFAAHDGTIELAGFERSSSGQTNTGYGRRIYVSGPGVRTVYAHLAIQIHDEGMRVRAGEPIGFVGRSGNLDNTTPTHLHFEVRVDGRPVDPLAWLLPTFPENSTGVRV